MQDNKHSYSSGRINRSAGQAPAKKESPPQRPVQQNAALQAPTRQKEVQKPSVFDYDAPPKSQNTAPQSLFAAENTPQKKPLAQQEINIKPRQNTPEVFSQLNSSQEDFLQDNYPPTKKAKTTKAKTPKNKKNKLLAVLAAVLCVCIFGAFLANHYFGQLLDPGAFGRIISNLDIPRAYSKKDVIHLLIVGIDYEEGRDYGQGLGLTDMILYARYDIKNNKLNMLQIPRDSYVGERLATGGTGKINALLISGQDKENPINNLAGPFQTMFQLPIDNYIALDMDALKTIVDTFGGIRVFVPKEMNFAGSYLPQGWQWLDGNAAEFFVRNREGAGFARGDIDRLDNQRHFYSALFRRLLNLTPKDVKNLLPVFDHYCNTDLSLSDMVGLGVAALNLEPEGVIFAKAPGATGDGLDPSGGGRSLYIIDKFGRGTPEEPGIANLLNQYFRSEGETVPAEKLELPNIQIPGGYALYPPNVQGMAEVQDPEGGKDIAVEPGAV